MTGLVEVSGLGTSVVVDLGEEIDPAVFRTAWSRCHGAGPNAVESVERPGRVIGPEPLMTSLTQVITRALIGRRAGELLMLHARGGMLHDHGCHGRLCLCRSRGHGEDHRDTQTRGERSAT